MSVLWTFREFSLCRHVRRELLRNAWLDFTPIIPVTACYQRNYVETYSRCMVSRLKWIPPLLVIPRPLGEQMIHEHQDLVGHGHRRLLAPQTCFEAPERAPQKRWRFASRPRTLDEDTSQEAIPFPCPTPAA